MIIVAELQMNGPSHAKINAAFLALLGRLDRDIILYAGREHANIIIDVASSMSRARSVAHKRIRVGRTALRRPAREFLAFINVMRILFRSALSRPDFIFVLSASPYAKYLINLLNGIFRMRIIVVCHGEMEGLADPRPRKWYRQNFWSERLLKKTRETTYCLVLGRRVYGRILERVPGLRRKQILVFEHPYPLGEPRANGRTRARPFRVATVGVASLAKRSQDIFALAREMKGEIERGDVAFDIIGKVEKDILADANDLVRYPSGNEFLPSDEYSSRISSTDMIAFFYDDALYELTPSGAVFDSLLYEKPVIAYDCSIFRDFFDLYGETGILCRDISGMADAVRGIISDAGLYEGFIARIRTAKKKLSIGYYDSRFRAMLDDAGIFPRRSTR